MPAKILKQDTLGNASPFSQLLVFLFITVVCTFIISFLGSIPLLIMEGENTDMTDSPNLLRWVQFVSSIGVFLLPALFFAWLCSDDLKSFFYLRKVPAIKTFFWALIGLFLLSPTIGLTEYVNRQMQLPEILAPLEQWMRAQEDLAESTTLLLLQEKGVVPFLFNILVIAVGAGITEEFYFRGAFQRIIAQWNLSPHAVIWITAIIFSAFHMQFYGFVPRVILGAYFGYLLLWSGCLWVPVFAHFANNAISVIAMSNSAIDENPYFGSELSTTAIYLYIPLACVGLFLLWKIRRRIKVSQVKQNTTSQADGLLYK